ncbi:MAG: hypothetical protein CL927_11790 [Deltaproteobacteria bacterium]|nr:hypothetical protein [Deltaproteobacteria bacterium]
MPSLVHTPLSRRHALGLGAASMLGTGTLARAADAEQRRFLFVHCIGGWDPFMVFAPLFGESRIELEAAAAPAQVGDLAFIDHPDRPAVTDFFSRWADHTSLVLGVESPSVNHTTCTRLMLTGDGASGTDDWGAILAAVAPDTPLLPMVALSGPWFARTHAAAVVPVGERGQLASLLDGSALTEVDLPVVGPDPSVQDLLDSFVMDRTRDRLEAASDTQVRTVLEAANEAQLRRMELLAESDSLRLGRTGVLAGDLDRAVELLETGLSRCVRLGYLGFDGTGFDTHSLNFRQSASFQELFAALDGVLTALSSRAGPSGSSLLSETVVVVTSEMGRHPQINGREGREHWTWTAAMLCGGGLVGGQTLGGWTSDMTGQPVDLATGFASEGGETLNARHLGATLLALGDVDPSAAGLSERPLSALLP